MSFETPIMRDISKLIAMIGVGVIMGFIVLMIFIKWNSFMFDLNQAYSEYPYEMNILFISIGVLVASVIVCIILIKKTKEYDYIEDSRGYKQ